MKIELFKISKKKLIMVALSGVLILVIGTVTSVYAYNLNDYKKLISNAKVDISKDKLQDAVDFYEKASNTYFGKKNITQIKNDISLVNKIKSSKKRFNEAEKLLSDKKYLDAIKAYGKVISDDKIRFSKAKDKIETSKKSYIADNVGNAKNEANNKNYDSAINYLNLVLDLHKDNAEATQLKGDYSNLKQQQEAKKAEEAKQLVNQVTETKNSQNVINASSTKQDSTTNNATQPVEVVNTQNAETITAANGWFHIDKHNGEITPDGFGFAYYFYTPGSLMFHVFNMPSTEEPLNFRITFHFVGGDVVYTGTTSDKPFSQNATLEQVPNGTSIKIDISIDYKGKNYSDSFSEVINNQY